MLNLNVLALTHLSRLFLPAMVEAGRGKILNLASTAAFQPGPLMAVYYASKAYVLSLSEALAEELRGTGVTVTVLCPGATRTEFQSRARTEGSGFTRMGMADALPYVWARGSWSDASFASSTALANSEAATHQLREAGGELRRVRNIGALRQ